MCDIVNVLCWKKISHIQLQSEQEPKRAKNGGKKKSDRNIEKRKIEYNKKEQAIEYSSLSHSHMLKHPLLQMATENNIT